MSSMSFLEFIAWGFFGLIAIYVAVRLGSAAFFKSKQQYESEKHHGP